MPGDADNPYSFWQELKRRKVIRVVTVYAAAAFVILELTDIVAPSLGLPDWTLNFIIVLLCVGFIITVILSWIYDITPDGIEKTKPVHKVQKVNKPAASNSWKIASYISFAVIAALIVLNIISRTDLTGGRAILNKSIAVLPFEDMSPQKDQEYFCDGMAEEIINALTHVEGLKVIARTSAFSFKGKHKDIREIGNKLGVETLLEGSIRKEGNRIRITAQLIKVEDGSHLWSERYDRDIVSVFDIQDEISLAIAENLKIKLLGEEKAVIIKRSTENIDAFNLYLQGKYYHRLLTPEGLQKAMEYYERALQKDPDFALVYVANALIQQHLSFLGGVPSTEAFPKVYEYANKALEIDNTIAGAYIRLGDKSMYYDWDWKAAERYFKQALQFNPNLASPLSNYSVLLTYTGRTKEAIAKIVQAREADPLSSWVRYCVGLAYYHDSQFDRAIDELQMALMLNPNRWVTRLLLGLVYKAKLMSEKTILAFEKAVELSNWNPNTVAMLAKAYYESGEITKAEELFDIMEKRSRVEYIPPSAFFIIHKARGENDLAYIWFERAINQRDSWLLPVINNPIERVIPDEPRFNELMEKVGLEIFQQ